MRFFQPSTTPYTAAGDDGAEPPPPPQPNQESKKQGYSVLPPGWTTAVHPEDGRLYYCETATGRTSWRHPLAPSPTATEPEQDFGTWKSDAPAHLQQQQPYPALRHQENPFYAAQKPDTHECHAVMALILFPPIGALALYHSLAINWAWDSGRYGDAINHSRQAPKYASCAVCLGILFWLWFLLFREGRRWDDWGEGWDFGN